MKMKPQDFLNILKRKAAEQDANLTLEQKRSEMIEVTKNLPVADGVTLKEVKLGGVRCLQQQYSNEATSHILYFHGGGYIMGSPETHLVFTSTLAKLTGASVWSLDYRLAPENPFPAAIEDAADAYEALLEIAGSSDRIVIAGDSAGGGLTTTSMLKARKKGLPMPAGLVMLSPMAELTCSGWSHSAIADRDFLAEPETLAEMCGNYVGKADRTNPLISPVHADLTGLPDMLIHVGSEEALLSDATLLAERAGAARVPVTLKIWPDMPHVFQLYAKFLEAGDQSTDEISQWIREAFSN